MLKMPTKQRMLRTLKVLPRRVMRYVSLGILRIFSPSQDKYPTIGVQPFTGDPAEKAEF